MISIIHEGERYQRGLNINLITDGGFVLAWYGRRRFYYFRVRGRRNPARPRFLYSVEVIPPPII